MSAVQKTPWGDLPLSPRILPRDAAPAAGQSGAGADVYLPESAVLLLALVASCEGRAPGRVLADAIAFYAERRVGLPALCDHDEFLRGGEAASRLAHNQEIAGASPASATSLHGRPAGAPAAEGGDAAREAIPRPPPGADVNSGLHGP